MRGKSCFTDWVLSQSSVLGPYYELLGSLGPMFQEPMNFGDYFRPCSTPGAAKEAQAGLQLD